MPIWPMILEGAVRWRWRPPTLMFLNRPGGRRGSRGSVIRQPAEPSVKTGGM